MLSSESVAEHVRSGTELKYIVNEATVDAVVRQLEATLGPDTYGGGDGHYQVASLYLDTPKFDSFHRVVPGKWRLRRYGNEGIIHIEYKAKPSPGQVVKHRSTVNAVDIATLATRPKPKWFARDVEANTLLPTQLVSYSRRAFMGTICGIDVRVTLDHDVRSETTTSFVIPVRGHSASPIISGRILEVKFEEQPPTTFLATLAEIGLEPISFSKYRTAMICAGH